MSEQLQKPDKGPAPKTDMRREETNRAFAEIVAAERRARLEKNMHLRSIRLLKQ